MTVEKYLYIIGGAVTGALARYWIAGWTAERLGPGFSYGTLIINLLGSFILGLFLTLHLDKGWFGPQTRLLVAVGFCASFTTYSTFSWETFTYIQEGSWRLVGWNITATVLGCLAATWACATLGRSL
jgi:CrcB protein